jgi:hypothetical protein
MIPSLKTKSLLLLINFIFWIGLASCNQQHSPVKSDTKRIVHPAPDQAKIDSLKNERGKEKKGT